MTIEVKDFSITPLQAKTGYRLNLECKLNCTNWIDKCKSVNIIIRINGQVQKVDTYQPEYFDWSGGQYTTGITMPSTDAFIEVSFQEDNKITRQISVINVSIPPIIPPSNGNGIDLIDNNMLVGVVAIFVVGAGVIYLLRKE